MDSQRRKDDLDEARLLREKLDMQWLLSAPEGRRIVGRILARTKVLKSTFEQSHALASFMEGERNVGLWWLAEVSKADPNYPLLAQQKT